MTTETNTLRSMLKIEKVAGNQYAILLGRNILVLSYDRDILQEMLKDEYSRKSH